MSLRGTLRFEIVTWPHTVRGVRNSWCGGRASLFWVRGDHRRGAHPGQQASVKTVSCYSLQNVMLIIPNHCFNVELDAIKYEQVLCFLLHYFCKSLDLTQRNKAWWEGSSQKKHE